MINLIIRLTWQSFIQVLTNPDVEIRRGRVCLWSCGRKMRVAISLQGKKHQQSDGHTGFKQDKQFSSGLEEKKQLICKFSKLSDWWHPSQSGNQIDPHVRLWPVVLTIVVWLRDFPVAVLQPISRVACFRASIWSSAGETRWRTEVTWLIWPRYRLSCRTLCFKYHYPATLS